jgi:hypothetical protein
MTLVQPGEIYFAGGKSLGPRGKAKSLALCAIRIIDLLKDCLLPVRRESDQRRQENHRRDGGDNEHQQWRGNGGNSDECGFVRRHWSLLRNAVIGHGAWRHGGFVSVETRRVVLPGSVLEITAETIEYL